MAFEQKKIDFQKDEKRTIKKIRNSPQRRSNYLQKGEKCEIGNLDNDQAKSDRINNKKSHEFPES